jgi:hypothetical protein
MEQIRFEKECEITQEKTGKSIIAEVISLKNKEKLVVNINRTVNMTMVWNGRVYEGRMAGMDFISDGPEIHIMNDKSKGRFHR